MTISPVLAAQSYDKARLAAAPAPSEQRLRSEAAFGAGLGAFAASLNQSEQVATQSMVTGANPHALVEALAATELAVETAVTVRDKVVDAYLEILRMPV